MTKLKVVKKLISENKIEDALNLLNRLVLEYNLIDYENEIVMFTSQFAKIDKEDRLGINISPEVFNKLKYNILRCVDTIAKEEVLYHPELNTYRSSINVFLDKSKEISVTSPLLLYCLFDVSRDMFKIVQSLEAPAEFSSFLKIIQYRVNSFVNTYSAMCAIG